MGGELEIRAIFPDGVVRINQFQGLRKPAGARANGRKAQMNTSMHTEKFKVGHGVWLRDAYTAEIRFGRSDRFSGGDAIVGSSPKEGTAPIENCLNQGVHPNNRGTMGEQ
jgi:hypothetical protein